MAATNFCIHNDSKAESSETNIDKVLHPELSNSEDVKNNGSKQKYNCIVDLRIDECNYDLNEEKIQTWLEHYGKVESEIEEEAVARDDQVVGTGTNFKNF